jgi:hypothetical protein
MAGLSDPSLCFGFGMVFGKLYTAQEFELGTRLRQKPRLVAAHALINGLITG